MDAQNPVLLQQATTETTQEMLEVMCPMGMGRNAYV